MIATAYHMCICCYLCVVMIYVIDWVSVHAAGACRMSFIFENFNTFCNVGMYRATESSFKLCRGFKYSSAAAAFDYPKIPSKLINFHQTRLPSQISASERA